MAVLWYRQRNKGQPNPDDNIYMDMQPIINPTNSEKSEKLPQYIEKSLAN